MELLFPSKMFNLTRFWVKKTESNKKIYMSNKYSDLQQPELQLSLTGFFLAEGVEEHVACASFVLR